jgi:hypothetical protein
MVYGKKYLSFRLNTRKAYANSFTYRYVYTGRYSLQNA